MPHNPVHLQPATPNPHAKVTPTSPSWQHPIHLQSFSRPLHRPRDTQIPNFLQHLLDPVIQRALSILLPNVLIQILLHLRHAAIRLRAEPQLNLDQRLEARIQIRHSQIDQLGDLGDELLVQGIVCGFRGRGFLLRAGQFGDVFVGLLDEPLYFCAQVVVVEGLVGAFFDAGVYVGEVGAEAGYGVEDCGAGVGER